MAKSLGNKDAFPSVAPVSHLSPLSHPSLSRLSHRPLGPHLAPAEEIWPPETFNQIVHQVSLVYDTIKFLLLILCI